MIMSIVFLPYEIDCLGEYKPLQLDFIKHFTSVLTDLLICWLSGNYLFLAFDNLPIISLLIQMGQLFRTDMTVIIRFERRLNLGAQIVNMIKLLQKLARNWILLETRKIVKFYNQTIMSSIIKEKAKSQDFIP